jgi:hypothetical protein
MIREGPTKSKSAKPEPSRVYPLPRTEGPSKERRVLACAPERRMIRRRCTKEMSGVPTEVDELAATFAQHRAIPFIGAGCSLGHLEVDWNAIRDEMAAALGIVDTDHARVAGAYARARGRDALIELLRHKLSIDGFDPSRGEIQLRLMGLDAPVMYTTNQDALIETCYAIHGRPLTVVSNISHIATMNARQPVLYKFHGDLAHADSIVFSDEDYARRMAPMDHPLDIRIRSDALARTFVFLGYSFRDPNVRFMFSHLQSLFRGNLPPSYLIQFRPDPSFAATMSSEFGVQAIDCRALYLDATTDAAAFFSFVRDLTRAVVGKKSAAELEERFKPKVPPSSYVATSLDVDAVDSVVAKEDIAHALRSFRGNYDHAILTPVLQARVTAQFVELCRRATEQDIVQLRAALLNLRVTEAEPAFEAICAAYALANVLPQNGDTFENHMPHLSYINMDEQAGRLLVVAAAFLLLKEWGCKPTPRFYRWVSFMLHSVSTPRAALDAELRVI